MKAASAGYVVLNGRLTWNYVFGRSGWKSMSFDNPKCFLFLFFVCIIWKIFIWHIISLKVSELICTAKVNPFLKAVNVEVQCSSVPLINTSQHVQELISFQSTLICWINWCANWCQGNRCVNTHPQCQHTVSSAAEIVGAPHLNFFQLCTSVYTSRKSLQHFMFDSRPFIFLSVWVYLKGMLFLIESKSIICTCPHDKQLISLWQCLMCSILTQAFDNTKKIGNVNKTNGAVGIRCYILYIIL